MKKLLFSLLCITVLMTCILCPRAYAADALDPNEKASLTLYYRKDGNSFEGLAVSIYRVAEALPDGTFELIEPYSTYPISIHGVTSQEQWRNIASTVGAYATADGVEPYRTCLTGIDGSAAFEELETGLYLVCEVIASNNYGTYIFNEFMVYLPTPSEDASYDYDVEAIPKCTSYAPRTEYVVTKLWQDLGNESDRPKQITVNIYKNGEFVENRVLDADNNWSYTWRVSADDYGIWTVVESSVPSGYTVTVRKNGACFSIINNHKDNSYVPDSPQTGDSFNVLPYVTVAAVSGIMMVAVGLRGRRQREA